MSDLLDAAVKMAMRRRQQYVTNEMRRLLSLCRSPIEEQFAAALFGTDAASLCFTVVAGVGDHLRDHGFYIFPQMPVRNYKADFGLILHGYTGHYRLVAECDGHDFHEKSKEQAAHDKSRDRAFLEEGWPVMRFTGSEIHRDALACADQASDFLFEQMLKDRRDAEGLT